MVQNNEINEMNATIARFMGINPIPVGTKRLGDIKPPDESIAFLNYHEKWDLLMPVVKKIKGMHLDILRQSFVMEYMHAAAPMNSGLTSIDLEKLHKGVYQFIQWYNQSKPTTNGTTE